MLEYQHHFSLPSSGSQEALRRRVSGHREGTIRGTSFFICKADVQTLRLRLSCWNSQNILYTFRRSKLICQFLAMVSSWPDFALDTAANRHKVDIIEQCLRHGSSPQTTGAELAAAVSSDENLKDGIISAWCIINTAINVFGSDEDIAKIVGILIAFASLAPTAEEAGIDSDLFETRSWTSLGWALNGDWNGGSDRLYMMCSAY
jgi:hypothetical protein